MSLSTYTELQTAVADWLNRSDLGARIPDFVALAEEKFDRRLRVRAMELPLAETAIAGGLISIPANTLAVKTLWVTGYEGAPLKSQSLEAVIAAGGDGVAKLYAWQETSWRFNGSGSVQGVLYRSIPRLSGVSSNWLLTAHPSAYLFASLAEAAVYLRDLESAAVWTQRSDAVIDEIAGNQTRDTSSGLLVARAR